MVRYHELETFSYQDFFLLIINIYLYVFFAVLLCFKFTFCFFSQEKNICFCNCVKIVHIRSFSGPQFPAFGLNTERHSPYSVQMRKNMDQNNSEKGQFSRSVYEVLTLFHHFFLIYNKINIEIGVCTFLFIDAIPFSGSHYVV